METKEKRLAGARGLRHFPSIRSFCHSTGVSRRRRERQLGGGHASHFGCSFFFFFFFLNFTCSWCQSHVDTRRFQSRLDLHSHAPPPAPQADGPGPQMSPPPTRYEGLWGVATRD